MWQTKLAMPISFLLRIKYTLSYTKFELRMAWHSEDMAHDVCEHLWAWPFDLETGVQCSTCNGVPSCQFWWYYNYSFSISGPFDHVTLWSLPLTLEVMAPAADVGRRPPFVYQVWSSWWPWSLTLELVCESHLKWGTFLPNLGMLGLRVLELFAMHRTDGQTKATPFPTCGSILTRGQSNLTKSASRGPIPRLGVTPGGRKLYRWIPGVGFPISVP